MIVGPNSALKLKQMPQRLENLLVFIVGKMEEEEKTPYEIAEVVVLATIMAMEDHEMKKKALRGYLGTPMVVEAFLLQGMPSPYIDDQTPMFPNWMDEGLRGLIPLVMVSLEEGPLWDEDDKAQVRYVAQLLWNQEVAHMKKDSRVVRVLEELDRLRREFKKTSRASTTSTTK